jgi:hypothetical protein
MKLSRSEQTLLRPMFSRLGRAGGKARSRTLSPARRREIAAMGGRARAAKAVMAKPEVPS